MTESERRVAIWDGVVFARVSPRQKFEIIKVLEEKHDVGFLGEGINDAPALKLANVAIVVESASDIAREAADVVLLQKSLATVIDGIREGRTIFANILKYLRVTLTSNFGNFYSVALASLFIPFVPLLPLQILLLNLLSDFPMIAIATDTVDPEELEKPKNYQVHSVVLMATLLGGVSSVFDFILFGALYRVSPETLQTAWFLLSVLTEIILIFSLRTRFKFFLAKRASPTLILLSLGAVLFALVLPFIPYMTGLLHFVRPTPGLLLFVGVLALGYFFATEAVKSFYYRHVHAGAR
jgi:Mg2+-importing ATPase